MIPSPEGNSDRRIVPELLLAILLFLAAINLGQFAYLWRMETVILNRIMGIEGTHAVILERQRIIERNVARFK